MRTGQSKYDPFLRLLREFAHPARLAIIDAILENNNCMEEAVLNIPTLSTYATFKHLQAMKKSGLIIGTITNNKVCYCVDWHKFDDFKSFSEQFYEKISTYRRHIESNAGKCLTKENGTS